MKRIYGDFPWMDCCRPRSPDFLSRIQCLGAAFSSVHAYEQLPGMPGAAEQPEYYAMLSDVARRADTPTIEILVAVTSDNELLGGVTFIGDAKNYNSGGTATNNIDSAGIRLLAVKPEARGMGVGKALTKACLQRTMEIGTSQVILHTTKSMEIAWRIYEGMGFVRSPDLDFHQGELSVYGFRLKMPVKTKRAHI